MADPNESHRDDRSQRPDAKPAAEDADSAEIVEAELVETPPEADRQRAAPGPADDEQFRQYQQFLEFQRFQEWQRQQGTTQQGETPPGTPPPEQDGSATGSPRRPEQRAPGWKKALGLLRYKIVRRLIYLVVILLVLYYLLHSLLVSFTGGSGGSSAPGTGGGSQAAAPIAPGEPDLAIYALYNYIGGNSPEQACALFTDTGKTAFAASYGTGDCPSAARQARAAVTGPASYRDPMFLNALQSTGTQTKVDSCAVQVGGGPALGTMRISRQPDGGWLIDQYAPANCG